MKKIILLIFFIFSINIFSNNLSIANFNAKRLGEDKKNYKIMADIILNFDIIGIEEVMNEKGLQLLTDELNKKNNLYSYQISKKSVGTTKYKEYYGIIYKKDKVNKIEHLGFYDKKIFIRPPYAFKIKSNEFDFVIILAHSIFGDKIADRVKEANNYYKVYNYFKNLSNEEDIILMGDFNLPANNKAFDNLKNMNLSYIIDTKYKTTLSNTGLANSYDNIFMDLSKVREFAYKYGVYNFAKDKNYSKIRNMISDHLIVFAIFNNDKDLDEK